LANMKWIIANIINNSKANYKQLAIVYPDT
jgi:hypothetical protein